MRIQLPRPFRRPGLDTGRLEAIFVAPAAGAPMVGVDMLEIIPGRGLAGDRYAEGRGFYQATDACQITLIGAEALERAERRTGLPLGRGEHRRNLVVRGLDPRALRGMRLRIGEAVLEYHKPRPPCGYLEKITRPGMVKALARHSGICLKAVQGGLIRVSDEVSIETCAG